MKALNLFILIAAIIRVSARGLHGSDGGLTNSMSRLLGSRQLATGRVCFDVSYVNGQFGFELVEAQPDPDPEPEPDPDPVTPPLGTCTEGAMGLWVDGVWVPSRCKVSCTDCVGVHAHYYVNTVCQSVCVPISTLNGHPNWECGYCSEISSSTSQEKVPQESSVPIVRTAMAGIAAVVGSILLAWS